MEAVIERNNFKSYVKKLDDSEKTCCITYRPICSVFANER